MQEKKKKPLDGVGSMALGTAMLGNFLPSDADNVARDEALGNFDVHGKKRENDEKN